MFILWFFDEESISLPRVYKTQKEALAVASQLRSRGWNITVERVDCYE